MTSELVASIKGAIEEAWQRTLQDWKATATNCQELKRRYPGGFVSPGQTHSNPDKVVMSAALAVGPATGANGEGYFSWIMASNIGQYYFTPPVPLGPVGEPVLPEPSPGALAAAHGHNFGVATFIREAVVPRSQRNQAG